MCDVNLVELWQIGGDFQDGYVIHPPPVMPRTRTVSDDRARSRERYGYPSGDMYDGSHGNWMPDDYPTFDVHVISAPQAARR